MRAYAIHRPIGPFTWPSEHRDKVADIVNYDTLTYVPEIGRNAFGHIDFKEDVPREDLDRYELVTNPMEDQRLLMVGRELRKFEEREQWDRFEAAWNKASEWGYSDSDIEHSYYWLGD